MAQYEDIKKIQALILDPNEKEYKGRLLPVPQSSGTITQKINYAFKQAEYFLNSEKRQLVDEAEDLFKQVVKHKWFNPIPQTLVDKINKWLEVKEERDDS